MKEKVFEYIKFYGSFTKEIDFAISKLKEIIQWSWVSKDMGIIDQKTHTEIYGYAIDKLVDLEVTK